MLEKGENGENNVNEPSISFTLKISVLAAFGYLFISMLTSSLLYQPDYIFPLWPAAGFGVLMIMLWGRRIVPGLYLGIIASLVLHDWVYAVPHLLHYPLLTDYVVPAFGNTLQAYVAGTLARKYIDNDKMLVGFFSIIKFTILCAALPSIISPSIFVTSTQIGNPELLPNWQFTWLLWWFGDVYGIVTFLPLCIILRQSRQKKKLWNAVKFGTPIILILIVTCGTFSLLRHQELQALQDRFNYVSNQFLYDLRTEMSGHEENLKQLISVSRSLDEFDDEQFYNLAPTSLFYSEGVSNITYIRYVPHSDRSKWESKLQAEGYGNFEFRDLNPETWELERAKKADYYIPILHEYPYEGNEPAHGLNLATHPVSGEIVRRAFQTNSILATPPIRLVQEEIDRAGVVAYGAIGRLDPGNPDPEQISGHNSVMLSFVFRLENIFESKWRAGDTEKLHLMVQDVTQPGEALPILSFFEIGRFVYGPTIDSEYIRSRYTKKVFIEFLDRKWELRIWAHKSFISLAVTSGSLIILFSSFVFILLLLFYFVYLFKQEQLIEREVEEQTKELRLAKERAESATNAKDEFLAMANHELRTPLNGIIATSEMLEQSELKPDQHNLVAMIQSSGRILLDLINDVLDFSRLEMGKMVLNPSPFSPDDLIEQWKAVVSVPVREKGISLNIKKDFEPGILLYGDRARLNQVAINLIGNAVKFTDEGSVDVKLEVSPTGSRRALFALGITDTGLGISEPVLKNIYEPFFQGDIPVAKKFGGTGLGLVISKRIVDLMGGDIHIESEKGKGTSVGVELEIDMVEKSKKPPKPDGPADVSFKNKRILVVEDNRVNQKVIQMLLKRMGTEIELVDTGELAVEKGTEVGFDLILMDCQLPGINGIEASRRILNSEGSANRSTPIIALTANTMKTNRSKCLEAGMVDFLEKPITMGNLKAVLKLHLK